MASPAPEWVLRGLGSLGDKKRRGEIRIVAFGARDQDEVVPQSENPLFRFQIVG